MIRKRLLIITVIVTVVAVVSIAAVLIANKKDQQTEETEYTSTTVNTTGLDGVLSQIPGLDEDAVNTSIMGLIRKNIESPKESYAANYRENSLTRSQTPSGKPLSNFLVDIPEIQRTFLVQVEGSQQTEAMTIYTLCPPAGQSAFGEQPCNDTP